MAEETLAEEVRRFLLGEPEKPKPKPEVEVVAEGPQPKAVTVGTVRSVGDVLRKLDPAMPEGTRFVRAGRVGWPDLEEMYWREVDRVMGQPKRMLVEFEYNPIRRFEDEIRDK